MRHIQAVLVLGAWACGAVPASPSETMPRDVPLRVRVSPAFARCIQPFLDAFTKAHGVAVQMDVGDPSIVAGADLVVGDDDELTRTLEGGLTDVRTAVDVGYVPWVLVVPKAGPGGPQGLSDLGRGLTGPVFVLGGAAGREVRARIQLPPDRLILSIDPATLRAASQAVVPVTLAGNGERRPLAVRPLVATAAAVSGSRSPREAGLLLDYARGAAARHAFRQCVSPAGESAADGAMATSATGPGTYAVAVVDWWLPACSLSRNAYNDPNQVLGPPDAVNLGGKDNFRGLMSLGQGGYVVVDMGQTIVDRDGPDFRVYQTTTGEPVSLYAAENATGAFTRVGLREFCGVRTPGVFSNHCDFDLAAAGIRAARYLKIEDGEIYPCLAGGTLTEGADIDAVEALRP